MHNNNICSANSFEVSIRTCPSFRINLPAPAVARKTQKTDTLGVPVSFVLIPSARLGWHEVIPGHLGAVLAQLPGSAEQRFGIALAGCQVTLVIIHGESLAKTMYTQQRNTER